MITNVITSNFPRTSIYDEFSSKLNLDEHTSKEAWSLLEKFVSLCPQFGEEPVWSVCAIYVISTNSIFGTEVQSRIHLSQLLRECNNMRLYDFFSPLNTFISTLQLSQEIPERLQQKYIVATLLYEKYQRLYSQNFRVDLESLKCKSHKSEASEKVYRFGWYLFLIAKVKLLKSAGDFVQCLYLMLSCINLLLLHMPESLRKRPIKEFLKTIDPQDPSQPSDTLYYLCQNNCANYDQVKDMQERIFNAWVHSLCTTSILKYQPAKVPPDPALSNHFYLGGLLDSSLDENEKSLCLEYEVLLYDSCDFDERLFLEGHYQLQSPMRPSEAPQNKSSSKMTPAKAIFSVNDWLIKNYMHTENEITSQTVKFINISPNPQELIEKINSRVNNLMNLVEFQAENDVRKSLVTKLYYHALESILLSESRRLQSFDFILLLSQDLFNKSLLAGCLEIVVCSYRSASMVFPWVLQSFNITPFEFYTIIECLITHVKPKLPDMVRKHLIRIEERILEELAWESNSPIYLGLSHEQRQLLKERLESSTGTPKKMHAHQNACQNFASLVKTCPSTNRIHRKVEFFMRKVAHLAHLRIQELVQELNSIEGSTKIRPSIVQQVEYAFMHILIQTTLLQDRHIDQLIMCILYGVCKLNSVIVTFKQIVDKYRIQPQANSQVFFLVRLNSSTKFGDIIKFYNTIFLPEVEGFLQLLDIPSEEKLPENETQASFVNLQVYSPLRLHKSPIKLHNLFISPRRTPLLLREHSPSGNTLILGSIKSPQSEIDRINISINRTALNKAKRKLDYNLSNESSETVSSVDVNQLKKRKNSTVTGEEIVNEDDDEEEINDEVVDDEEEEDDDEESPKMETSQSNRKRKHTTEEINKKAKRTR